MLLEQPAVGGEFCFAKIFLIVCLEKTESYFAGVSTVTGIDSKRAAKLDTYSNAEV